MTGVEDDIGKIKEKNSRNESWLGGKVLFGRANKDAAPCGRILWIPVALATSKYFAFVIYLNPTYDLQLPH